MSLYWTTRALDCHNSPSGCSCSSSALLIPSLGGPNSLPASGAGRCSTYSISTTFSCKENEKLIYQSINRAVNRAANQSIDQSINQSIDQSITGSIAQPIIESSRKKWKNGNTVGNFLWCMYSPTDCWRISPLIRKSNSTVLHSSAALSTVKEGKHKRQSIRQL